MKTTKIINPRGLNVRDSWKVNSTTPAGIYLTVCKTADDARACCLDLNRYFDIATNRIVPPWGK